MEPVTMLEGLANHVWAAGRAVLTASVVTVTCANPSEQVEFGRDILPILSNNCFQCHGPDEGKREAKFRLDNREGVLRGGKSGDPAIIPGESGDSELIWRVTSEYEDEMMPPPEVKQRLSARQIELLKRWVDQGAPWGTHWAYETPRRPAIPTPPGAASLARNPVDGFILARLAREGIDSSPEADRRTLVRRLSFDLLGLPPDLETVRAFVEDPRSDAYERLVDSLLASPHFGERWARHWLDLARYADSGGYTTDPVRPYAYVYRDWVIDAINRDLPFDRFTIEQLAGDLLPEAGLPQRIATGFHRNSLKNDEGGVDLEEDRCKVAVERTATTGSIWLGLTVGCAECHTHKFDQITQREFYQLYAFFNGTSDEDIPAPQPAELAEYKRRLKTWEPERAKLERRLRAYLESLLDTKLPEWERAAKLPVARWTVLKPDAITFETENDEIPLVAADDHSVALRPGPFDPFRAGRTFRPGRFIVETTVNLENVTAFRVEALADPGGTVGRGRRGDFALSEFSAMAKIGDGAQRIIELVSARADHAAPDEPAAQAIDGDTGTGWSVSPEIDRLHVIVFELRAPMDFPDGSKLFFELRHQAVGLMSRFRLAATSTPAPVEASTISDTIMAIFDLPREQRSREQQFELARHFAGQVEGEERELLAAVTAHEAKRPEFPPTTAAVLVPEARRTHIHVRGDFLRKGDEVGPATLAALHPFQSRGKEPDRLDLARWLVDPANPLTARVTINRIWKHLFGRGNVATVDDFGTRGELPSHPELLDYLATEFVRQGWSRKRMIRLIVNSATYRQSSAFRDELRERDPLNVLLARQNRNRLEAEVIRDTFLATSGLLNATIGGPSIYPPLPGFVTGIGRIKTWPATEGPERYRRGLYVHLRRSTPYPMLLTFDAPDPSVACFRRERTNTPLQALTLLNDPVFVECSRTLGEDLAKRAGTIADRLRRGFEHCLSRPPKLPELQALRALYDDQLDFNQGDAGAAMGAVARVVMNLDEFITRD